MSTKKKIPQPTRSRILIANRHSCCVCRRSDVQIHHINGDNSDNREENLAVLCLDHHDKATAPRGLTARLKSQEVTQYKLNWEQQCRELSQRIARARTAFFMVDYKNAERIRQLYSQLSSEERKRAYHQLRGQFQEEKVLRDRQGFDCSLEPTTYWNPTVEKLVQQIETGKIHPDIFKDAKGHPRDPLYPVGMDDMPPSFFLYDMRCQIMVRAILASREAYVLDELMHLDQPAQAQLSGHLASFHGRLHGKVADPDEYTEKPVTQTLLTVEQEGVRWRSILNDSLPFPQ
ncbi:MAG: hypothetical protein AMJ91_05130 [candidate division Zixibacteria bacterium SM23_73_3]|nr:MAG: hypothetical protein AMJ91_05130 [candidate division Zixibacteria bacterium SM23_73_3]